jgi:hypothetical protein
MADLAKRAVGPKQLASSTTTEYTVPSSTQFILRHIHLSNPTGSAVTFTCSIGADAAGTRMWDAFSIPPGATFDWSGSITMEAAETLRMHAGTATALVATVSGVEVT